LHHLSRTVLVFMVIVFTAACSQIGTGGAVSVPTTGDSANDVSSASQFLPTLGGYLTVADAGSISDALTAIGAPASILTGNPIAAAAFAQVDGMIGCYQNVGALAAKVYVQTDIGAVVAGQVPRVGAMAVINQDRLANNFLPCALGSEGSNRFGAQGAEEQIQPCTGSGTFSVNNETLTYVYAATNPDLCAQFQAAIPNS